MPVEKVTEWVRGEERILAPGSETSLWGEYVQAAGGWGARLARPRSWPPAPQVDTLVVAWWVGAYCAAGAVKAVNCDKYPADPYLLALLPAYPQEGDWRSLDELLGRPATPAEREEMAEGYGWHMEEIQNS